MQKSTITYRCVDYPVRTLDVRSLPEYNSPGYAAVNVADETLLAALGSEDRWGSQERAIDDQIMFYFVAGYLEAATDEQLIEVMKVCF